MALLYQTFKPTKSSQKITVLPSAKKTREGIKNMGNKCINRLIGKKCKIVAREPGEKNPFTISGTLTEFDDKNGFLIIESKKGTGCINISTVEAIKPR